MIAFGDRLRQAREKIGLSLDEVAARTKIRASILDAIERADLTRLPVGFYTKAFLRAYAAEVHLDPEPIVQEYAALLGAPAVLLPPAEPSADRVTLPRPMELFALVRPGLAPVGMVALAGILLFFVYTIRDADQPGGSSGAEPEAAATTGTLSSSPSQDTQGTGERTDAIAALGRQAERLTVEVRPTGPLWLEGTADGRRVVRRLLQPHETLVVEARDEMRLVIGDAGAFDFSINGRPGRPLGGPGQVRTVEVRRDNYRKFLAVPQ